MAFFDNFRERFAPQTQVLQKPALPQMGVLPQVTPVKQLTGIGSMLPMQTITLPGGQTVQIPQLNMDEINANLLAAGITPQTPLPNIIPEVATPTTSLPVATPSLPVAAPITTGYNDGNNAVTGDFNPYERVTGATNPVYTPPSLPITTLPDLDYGAPSDGLVAPAVTTPSVTTPDLPITTMPSIIGEGNLTDMRTRGLGETVGAGFDPTQGGTLTLPVEQPLAPYTGAGQTESPNYIPTIQRNETGMDALTQQLLFGLDGQGGFIPGAMRAAEKTFFNADGTPRVVEEQRAGFYRRSNIWHGFSQK